MHNCQTRRCGVGLCFRIHEGAAGARDFVDSACLLERSQTREGKKGKQGRAGRRRQLAAAERAILAISCLVSHDCSSEQASRRDISVASHDSGGLVRMESALRKTGFLSPDE